MKFPLVSNERVKDAVENMLSGNKIPHAILIEGISGTGKTVLADYICKAAVCEGEDVPCGKCTACRLFDNLNHPDIKYITLDKDKKSIPISAVRDIISNSAVLPQRSRNRVFVIDKAHTLTVQAQNALLKILEEPPDNTVFILMALSRDDLLKTVVSRCAVLTLGVPDISAAENYANSLGFTDKEQIASAYKSARGSIGGMLSILSGKSGSKADTLASEFLEGIKNLSEYELLKLLFPIEKDRNTALDFYNALEVRLALLQRDCTSPTLAKRYYNLYGEVLRHKNMLKTNANLSLLLSSLVMSATAER